MDINVEMNLCTLTNKNDDIWLSRTHMLYRQNNTLLIKRNYRQEDVQMGYAVMPRNPADLVTG